jgi:hypothetical protein
MSVVLAPKRFESAANLAGSSIEPMNTVHAGQNNPHTAARFLLGTLKPDDSPDTCSSILHFGLLMPFAYLACHVWTPTVKRLARNSFLAYATMQCILRPHNRVFTCGPARGHVLTAKQTEQRVPIVSQVGKCNDGHPLRLRIQRFDDLLPQAIGHEAH